MGQTWHHFAQLKTAVESVTKLSKIARYMSLTDCMITSTNGIFDVAKHCVHPLELFDLNTVRTASRDNTLMDTICFLDSRKAAKTMSDNYTARCQVFLGPLRNFLLGKCVHLAEAHLQGMPFFVRGNSSNKRGLGKVCTAAWARLGTILPN